MPNTYIIPVPVHNALVDAAYRKRGFTADESAAAVKVSEWASWHGIKTHNALKGIGLDDHLGSRVGGCVPGAVMERLPSKYKAVARWNANKKLGQAAALEGMNEAMRLADEFGIGAVAIDNAFHYLWGGGYVIDAAKKGYIAYTNCTAASAEVVPFQGKYPTLGTNPHSWGFPTQDVLGFPICIDWATSVIASGRVAVLKREGKPLPPGAAVDADGKETLDPNKVRALVPFGQHKGYGLALIDELYAAYIGGSLPTLRNRWKDISGGEKGTCYFYFQCIRPDAISGDDFAKGRSQMENVKAIFEDIKGHGNENVMLPGEIEARGAALSQKHGGLLFTKAEVEEFAQIAKEVGHAFDASKLRTAEM